MNKVYLYNQETRTTKSGSLITISVTQTDVRVELNILAIGSHHAILIDRHLFVEGLNHGPKLSHVEDVGITAMKPYKVFALKLGPAGLNYVKWRTYDKSSVSEMDDGLTVGRLEAWAKVLV